MRGNLSRDDIDKLTEEWRLQVECFPSITNKPAKTQKGKKKKKSIFAKMMGMCMNIEEQ